MATKTAFRWNRDVGTLSIILWSLNSLLWLLSKSMDLWNDRGSGLPLERQVILETLGPGWKERKNERCIDTVYGRIIFETYVDRQIDIINEIDKIDKTNEIDKNDRMIDETNRYNHSTEISRHKCMCEFTFMRAGDKEIQQVCIFPHKIFMSVPASTQGYWILWTHKS